MKPGASVAEHFSDARYAISTAQIKSVAKRMKRDEGFGLTGDAQALPALAARLRAAGCTVFYQPYKEAKGGQPEQPFIFIWCTPWQARMLDAFGRQLIFMDATFGTNRYGYPFQGIGITDNHGRAVLVGQMLSNSENTEVIELFLRQMQGAARAAGDGTFKFGRIMIDKSRVEMAAVDQLVSTGDAEAWLLCYFHFLQEWERFLTSLECGVAKEQRHRIMLMLAKLVHQRDKTAFEQEVAVFHLTLRGQCPKVCERMEKYWQKMGERWAWWGRLDILYLQSNTNNGLERTWGTIKYTDLDRKTQSTVHELVIVIITKTIPRQMQSRAMMVAGRVTSDQQQREQRAARAVEHMVNGGKVVPAGDSDVPGLTYVHNEEGEVDAIACAADLSCSCGVNAERVCVHVRAAAKLVGFTHNTRVTAAAYLVYSGRVQVHEELGVCTMSSLADVTKAVHCRVLEGSCTCLDKAAHGICCHLLAAAQLPAFANQELPLAVQLAAPEDADALIELKGRVFQQAATEPLYDCQTELQALYTVQRATADSIKQQTQTSCDPTMARLSSQLAAAKRMALQMSAEDREQAAQHVNTMHSALEQMHTAAQLKPTATRAGKQARRKNGRSDDMHKTVALLPGRKNNRGVPLAQQLPADCGDALPMLRTKDPARMKMRGVTIPGNTRGTTLRNGSSHHRLPSARQAAKRQKNERGEAEAAAAGD